MPDNHYENAKLAEIYDLDSPWSIDRDFYVSLVDMPRQSILDLGCGTGLLCNAYAAKNHDITGVDPSAAMLEVARRKPHGRKIAWVQSFAQNYRSDKRFDLIIMTGHAFQVLLEDDDILATFAVMRQQLNHAGRIVFESRNPAIDWAATWDYDMAFEWQGNIVREARQFLATENDRMTFELRYEFPDEVLVSVSKLRFLSRKDIEARLVASGLQVERVLGDWDATAFDELSSREIIFVARPANYSSHSL